MTYFLISKKVSARDLFGERLKKFGIREEIAPAIVDEVARCLTDGSNFLAVFLTEDGFVDFLEAYGVDAPRKILNAISETFGTEIFSEHEPQYWGFQTQEEWNAAIAKIRPSLFPARRAAANSKPACSLTSCTSLLIADLHDAGSREMALDSHAL